MVAHWLPSKIIRLLTLLMLFQFVGAALMAPGDGGVWFCRMCRLYFGVDVFFLSVCTYSTQWLVGPNRNCLG